MCRKENSYQIECPPVGLGINSMTVTKWCVSEGELFTKNSILCTVETDREIAPIPVPWGGTLQEQLCSINTTIQPGDPLATVEISNTAQIEANSGDDRIPPFILPNLANRDAIGPQDSNTPQMDTNPTLTNTESPLTPAAISYATNNDVSPRDISGSGPDGTIVKDDLVDQEDESTIENYTVPSSTVSESDDSNAPDIQRREIRGVRKTIAENMMASHQGIPHVSSGYVASAETITDMYQQLQETREQDISWTALFLQAIVPGLEEVPILNARVDSEKYEIEEHRTYDIGIATHTEKGLLVPVIRSVSEKSVLELSDEINDTIHRARTDQLTPEELQGSTFTVSNIGNFSKHGTFGTPIINAPETAILSIGRITDEPVAVDSETVKSQKRVRFSLSYDHRVIDGVTAERFMNHVISNLQSEDAFTE